MVDKKLGSRYEETWNFYTNFVTAPYTVPSMQVALFFIYHGLISLIRVKHTFFSALIAATPAGS